MSELPKRVTIREVALRDGLQIEQPITLSNKLELLAAIVATGVREVEATAFVSPTKVPALADAPELAAKLADYPDFLNMRRVINSLDQAQTIALYANTFLSALGA